MFGSTTQKQNTHFKQHNTHFHPHVYKKNSNNVTQTESPNRPLIIWLERKQGEKKKKNPYIEETKFWIKE